MKRLALATWVALGLTAVAVQLSAQEVRSTEPPSQPPRTSSEAVPVSHVDEEPGHAAFRTLDTNGDGRINRAEAKLIENLDFAAADTNGDSSLSRPEYLAAMATVGLEDGEPADVLADRRAPRVSFETADKNKDGRVNRAEASEIPGLDFTAADTNEDASLTRAEYRSALPDSRPRG